MPLLEETKFPYFITDAKLTSEKNILERLIAKPFFPPKHAYCRFLFWLSGGMSPSIQRSDVTGQMKITLIKITEQLRALSIDRVDKRLFWVQFGPQGESAIASCDYNGNALHTMNLPLQ